MRQRLTLSVEARPAPLFAEHAARHVPRLHLPAIDWVTKQQSYNALRGLLHSLCPLSRIAQQARPRPAAWPRLQSYVLVLCGLKPPQPAYNVGGSVHFHTPQVQQQLIKSLTSESEGQN